MFPSNNPDLKPYNLQQQVSLEKHQHMIQSALEWQRHSQQGGEKRGSWLKAARTLLTHLVIGH